MNSEICLLLISDEPSTDSLKEDFIDENIEFSLNSTESIPVTNLVDTPLIEQTKVIDNIQTPTFNEVDIKEAFMTLKPRKRMSLTDEEEVVNVTYIPKQSKPKEVIEQEFSIKAHTYEEEEISMTGNVKLHRKSIVESPEQSLTINEIGINQNNEEDLEKPYVHTEEIRNSADEFPQEIIGEPIIIEECTIDKPSTEILHDDRSKISVFCNYTYNTYTSHIYRFILL